MYITKDIFWTLRPAVAVGITGGKDVNYNISIKASFLKWRLHFGWYEGNPDKAPF